MDLLTKADVSTVHLKADAAELTMLDGRVEEAKRQLDNFEKATIGVCVCVCVFVWSIYV